MKPGTKLALFAMTLLVLFGGYKIVLPRSLRNNNPLNIKDDHVTNWVGLDDPRGDGTFLRFTDPKYSYRAGTRILRNYRRRGIVQVEQIIATWAPQSENPTSSYIALVREKAGFQPGHVVAEEEGDLIPLFKAMAVMEGGAAFFLHPALSDATIKAGIALA